ncbi:putative membrane protein YdjX (TVP38/TMEM64 family) [Natranaerovirga hydrolytica]|uniref:TVP38/TMEM64 family membrane protein n=1 Tax=Natranaerovirga hydrolytica TaxID=680378 RepID=A0A4R1MIY1_9FIRM|nr:VTT domain-containing protein [Natranaerovirga hydrolytica]TCK92698.1 putative membrane protein YdjX (TVP38/TMEM64 family) [Natranaerovirga hydrolytica]
MKSILKVMLGLALIIVVTTVVFLNQNQQFLSNIMINTFESKIMTSLIIIILFCVKPIFCFIPYYILYTVIGYFFSKGIALVLIYTGLILNLTIGFLLGKKLGKDYVRPIIMKYKYSKKVIEIVEKNGVLSCLIIRFLPTPPSDVSNMFFGTTNVSYHTFLISSLMGLTPGIIPFLFLGEAISNPLSESVITISIVSILSIMVVCGIGFIIKKKYVH